MEKTNAMRILERAKAEYNVHTYEGGALSGVAVAQALGEEMGRVYKTLVTVGSPRRYYVFVIPVAAALDLKKAAKAAGAVSAHGLCARRLFAAGHEEGVSDLFPHAGTGADHLCQRGKGGRADRGLLRGPSAPDGRQLCRSDKIGRDDKKTMR